MVFFSLAHFRKFSRPFFLFQEAVTSGTRVPLRGSLENFHPSKKRLTLGMRKRKRERERERRAEHARSRHFKKQWQVVVCSHVVFSFSLSFSYVSSTFCLYLPYDQRNLLLPGIPAIIPKVSTTGFRFFFFNLFFILVLIFCLKFFFSSWI